MVQIGSAQGHIDKKQVGATVQLYTLFHLALLGALEEGCVHLEEQLLFLSPHRHHMGWQWP